MLIKIIMNKNKNNNNEKGSITRNSLRKIRGLSRLLQKTIEADNYIFNNRNRKTNIFDGFLFRLLYCRKNSSQDKAAAKLNALNYNILNKSHASRQAFKARDDKLSIEFYKKILESIDLFVKKNVKRNKTTSYFRSHDIYAVDGVKNNLRKALAEDGFPSNPNNESITSLTIGIYDIASHSPVCLNLVNHSDERKAFIDSINDKYINSIFIFDRGYQDKKLFASLAGKGIKCIFRIRDNTTYIPTTADDTVLVDGNFSIRIVTYQINNTNYHLATNLFDCDEFTIDTLKDLYHKRWDIEEFFKYIKSNFLVNLYNKDIKQQENHMINKAVLIDGLFDEFLFKLIHNDCTKNCFSIYYTNYAVRAVTHRGKSNEWVCTRPNMKWYGKSYVQKKKKKID